MPRKKSAYTSVMLGIALVLGLVIIAMLAGGG